MRKSSLRHPVAVLRSIIGMTQPQFAKLVKISLSTLTKIESLQLPLSEDHAREIMHHTDAPLFWLLEGDPSAPPKKHVVFAGDDDGCYTLADFEKRQVHLAGGGKPGMGLYLPLESLVVPTLYAVKVGAVKARRDQLFAYRLNKAVRALMEEFGGEREVERLAQYKDAAEGDLIACFTKRKKEVLAEYRRIAKRENANLAAGRKSTESAADMTIIAAARYFEASDALEKATQEHAMWDEDD